MGQVKGPFHKPIVPDLCDILLSQGETDPETEAKSATARSFNG